MDIGIGLPNAVRGVGREGIVDWAARAERAGFSSLGTIDRIVYENVESLIALAAAAAVTERIRLVTDILIAPLRDTGMLAKQAASVDRLSGGRLTLGLAVGGREDDFSALGKDFHARGKAFDTQLEEMARIWKGEAGIGPAPANGQRPGLLIGGTTDVAYRRAARFADGWTLGGGPPEALAEGRPGVQQAWQEAGREGSPRIVALLYFALGPDAQGAAQAGLGHYYAWLGDYAQQIVDASAKDAQTLKTYLSAFEQAGADEVICFPASADPAQVELLAEAVL